VRNRGSSERFCRPIPRDWSDVLTGRESERY
jgi:hypothetical protein